LTTHTRSPTPIWGAAKPARRGVEHRLDEVVDQALDRRVDARHLLRLLAKRRVLKSEDGTDHEIDFTRDPLKPNPTRTCPPLD